MPEAKRTTYPRARLAMAGTGLLMGFLPVAFPGWATTIAESYTARRSPTVNSERTSDALGRACGSGLNIQTAFQDDCELPVPSGERVEEMLTPYGAASLLAMQQIQAGRAVASARLVGARLASGMPAFRPGELIASHLLYGQHAGGAASGDLAGSGLSAFVNIEYRDTSRSRDEYIPGFNQDGWTLTLGADTRVTESFVFGGMANISRTKIDLKKDLGEIDVDGWGLAVYGTYFIENGAFLEGVAGFVRNDYDLSRRFSYSTEQVHVNQTAKASADGDLFYVSLGGGYTFARESLSFTPQLSLNYARQSVDSYRESMSNPSAPGGSLALAVGSQNNESLTSRVGFVIANAVSAGIGVVVPQLSFDWVHEFSADARNIPVLWVNDRSGQVWHLSSSPPDRNYYDIGVGLSAQFAHGRSGFIAFNRLLGYDKLEDYAVTAGFRMEF
ncbi:MAG: autotransporter outer membrane beta-barrel domain-containing protein [Chromatiaceae bacterium]|nr:MAG: autotransporter outer membrane beta-barrel domain-containing protein [Chromatiaceae bacterium]